MNDPKPHHLAYVYSKVESYRHLVGGPSFVLLVKGYAYCRLESPDGTSYYTYDGETPCLFLAAPGMHIDFKTTTERENGYIEFNAEIVRMGRPGYVEIGEGADWIEVPCAWSLSAGETTILSAEMKALCEAWSVPIPLNVFRVKAGIIGLLRRFVERAQPAPTETLSPAQKMRRLIDDDKRFARNLADLGQQCGYSNDHLRKLFRERYHISPLEYRTRQRLGRAMDLMVATDLTLAEIAAETGFQHLSHFCTSFKKAFNLTPAQGLKRFRHKTEKQANPSP